VKTLRARVAFAFLLALTACKQRPEVPILGFHAVVDSPGQLDVTPAQLNSQLDALAHAGFHAVSLHAVLDHEDHGDFLPPRPIVLTFDDGTADAVSTVLPILRARGMTATFFIVSSWLGKDEATRMTEPLEPGEPSRPVLTWPELLLLKNSGMEIGSHSRTHARLPQLEDAVALREMTDSKRELEVGLRVPVDLFAYPYNSLRSRLGLLLHEAGYRAAVAGQDHGNKDRESLYRIGVYRDTTPEELVRFAQAGKR
jgi:peptidoglycan/xylan/chitin deacetylase (PgdA/CDA1 family)